ncbi:MAG: hypothetical protein ABI398_15270 [Devosia sp.]
MGSPAAAISEKREGHSVGFNLAVIGLAAVVGGLALAYLIDGAERSKNVAPPSSDLVSRTLGVTILQIPAGWLADPGGAGPGFAKQVDLTLTLPLGPGGAARVIDVTLTQRSRVRPSASLLDGVYLHQFLPEQLNGPPGLIGKPMAPTEGYDSETVWYDPIAPAPFVAKCEAPITEGRPGKCLRTVYLGSGIAAVYGFDDDILVNWKKFDAALHPVLNQIGAI